MTNRSIFNSGLLIFLLSVIFATIVIGIAWHHSRSDQDDALVFMASYHKAASISKIMITSPDSTVTLLKKTDYWRVEEGDEYYADMIVLDHLFALINSARIIKKIPMEEKYLDIFNLNSPLEPSGHHLGTLIRTFDDNGNVIDAVIVGIQDEKGIYRYFKPLNQNEIWQASSLQQLPQRLSSWYNQPLIRLDTDLIQKIYNQSGLVSRRIPGAVFYNQNGIPANVTDLTDRLLYLSFEDVKNSDNFNESLCTAPKTLTISTFEGLVLNLKIYSCNDDFWVSLRLSSTTLPTLMISDYIRDNSFLYDGWFFRLSTEIGRLLYNLQLH